MTLALPAAPHQQSDTLPGATFDIAAARRTAKAFVRSQLASESAAKKAAFHATLPGQFRLIALHSGHWQRHYPWHALHCSTRTRLAPGAQPIARMLAAVFDGRSPRGRAG